jgi:hypothetical protein
MFFIGDPMAVVEIRSEHSQICPNENVAHTGFYCITFPGKTRETPM